MKILYFIESLGPGGKERRLVELIYSLVKSNEIECEIVLTKNEIHYKKILELGVKIHVLERRTKKDPSIFWKFYNIAKSFKPDIIHVWGNMVATYAIPSKILLGIPLINNQITDAPLEQQRSVNFWFNFFFSDKIIANTAIGLKKYNVNANKSQVIYNGFDFNRINALEDKEKTRRNFDIKPGFVVGMVANFSNSKDYNTYINAALKILQNYNNVTFLCVGSGNNKVYMDMIPYELKSSVLFLGTQQNVESIINICDIGVLTSYGEGISNALLEFMAIGKPVIATNLGGNPELIKEGFNGYLIAKSDHVGLSEIIIKLINDDKTREQIGANNRNTIKEKFSIDKMKNSFVDVYRSFIK